MQKTLQIAIAIAAALGLAACQPPAETASEPAAAETGAATSQDRLAGILAARPDDVKARYAYRHPQETLEFIGIEPGMTVVEGLPGRGWYTKVLLPYIGTEGGYIGANYSMQMWPNFSFADEAFLDTQSRFVTDWPVEAAEWGGADGAPVAAFYFGSLPDEMAGTADVVFFPRVLHNLVRFQNAGAGNFLDEALADAYNVLKPGGVFGVVQHHARDDMPDQWADGNAGYLKKQFVIDAIEAAGFEFVAESDVNANELDQPTIDDIVWRLPPRYATSGNDPELRATYEAIGESNRMTLKFRKP